MFDLFKRTNKTGGWLRDYPPYQAPHVGVGRTLSEAQASENLDYLLANKAQRLHYLAELVEQFDIDVMAGLDSNSPQGLVDALYHWADAHWSDVAGTDKTRNAWPKSTRDGDDLIYSVVTDTAIALGQLLVRHRPTYAWGLDLDASNVTMASYRRCVVQAPMKTCQHMAIADVEQMVAERVFNAGKPHWKWENQWLRALNDHLSGTHEGTAQT